MTEPVTLTEVSALLTMATDRLAAAADSDSPRLDAEVLLAHALRQDRSWLYAHGNDTLDNEIVEAYRSLIERRGAGEPVAYLTGFQEFWSLRLKVGPGVLIPRGDTELLVELALQQLGSGQQSVLELGTGSAAIAIALSREKPKLKITATEVSPDALRLARRNIDHHQCVNINLLESDWYAALHDQRFDMLVSNPPYIAENDPHLSQGDLRSEPLMALSSGPAGMTAINHIISNASNYLRPGASILLEHGYNQAELVQQLLHEQGYRSIKTHKDTGQNDRVTCAQQP